MKKLLLLFVLFFSCAVFAADSKTLPGFIFIPASKQLKSFYIGKYPITNAQYQSFLQGTPQIRAPKYWQDGRYPIGKENHPVVFIAYDDALKYCEWLESKYPAYAFRLPTVAEWEHAALGPNNYQYPWGNEAATDKMNFNQNVASFYLKQNPTVSYTNPKSAQYGKKLKLSDIISIQKNGAVQGWINHKQHTGFVYTDLFQNLMAQGGYTTAVDAYPRGQSYYGVYDMSGNTWDWTSTDIVARNGAEKGQTVKAIKGGSWYATANSCKVSMSGEGRRPAMGYNTVGFRVVAIKK